MILLLNCIIGICISLVQPLNHQVYERQSDAVGNLYQTQKL